MPYVTQGPQNVTLPDMEPGDLVRQSILVLALVILAAKFGGELMIRLGQPAVLGELLAGVLLGNLGLFGVTLLNPLRDNMTLRIFAEVGAILLLFETGIESDLAQLLAVGWSSLLVALLGVAAPLALGYFVSLQIFPNANWLTHVFVGGTLTATSVGITARVLKDLRKNKTNEAQIILGAAVVDDVIGLIVLAAVGGAATAAAAGATSQIGWDSIAWTAAKAILFLIAAVLGGRYVSRYMFRFAARLKTSGAVLAVCIPFCLLLAAAAAAVGLAPIVGAFAAGVVIEQIHYAPLIERGGAPLQELLSPLTEVVTPAFFVLMGFLVDLKSFASMDVLGFAVLVTIAAIVGKQICALGVLERRVRRLAIGVGMIPRGEVGLIFAGLGRTIRVQDQPILSNSAYSSLVLMVILTTVITPPLLNLTLKKPKAEAHTPS
jgi:Kef-type K+ transport system membrane component KefB